MVPVVNENDTTATDEINFGDNDFLAAQIAVFLHARILVLLTNTDGLYRSDPRVDPKARLVKEVRRFEQLREVEVGRSPSHLGRGGMTSKIAAAEMATQSGVRVVICNGRSDDAVVKVAKGKRVGTHFIAKKSRKAPERKLWLKYGSDPAGAIRVDDGAAERLRTSGASLLAVGVLGLVGQFEAGDVVEVRDQDDEKIGRGITEFSARELKRIRGRKSQRIREQFPGAPDEVIHRDRFVLL
jgi:glutamate 5-kinase